MKTQIINDSYNVTSSDVGEFKEEIIKLNKSTESVNAYITQSTILSFKNKEEIDVEGSLDKIRIYKFYAFDDETLTKMTYNEKTVNLKTVLVNGEENQKSLFLNEIIDSTGILIQYKDSTNRIYLDGISKYALKSLCERAGVRGERYTINSFFRDAYIAGGLITMPDHKANKMELRRYDNLVKKGLKFIRRKNPDNDYKLGLIVGVFSGDYIGSSTDILLKTYEYFEKLKSVGEISLDKFYLSQEKSQVSFYLNHLSRKYNKKYKIDFPLSIGIDTYKSDTGKLSLRADLFFEIYGIKYVFKNTSKKQNETIKNKAFIYSIKRKYFIMNF